jgi:hypothetical protein
MTRRFDQIVTNQISEQVILVESIPHLLHQDLAYLWILGLPREQRPHIWGERIQMWHDLAALFFSGQLELERVSVGRIPLGQLLADVGLQSVSWLRLKQPVGSTRPNPVVGVTSPTVIVRPLPTFDSATATPVHDAAVRRPDEASYFVRLALKALASMEGSTAETLTRVLSDEFGVRLDGDETNRPQAGVAFRLPILKEIDWCNQSKFEEVSFLTRSDGPRAWVPRCENCNQPITVAIDQPPVTVAETDQTVSLQCQSCRSKMTIDLKKLLVWQRSANQVVIWKPDNDASPDRLPPEPSVRGIDVTWEWNAAVLGGEANRRFLKLRFPNRSITVQDMDDIFYETFLTSGSPENFQGLPVKGDWYDALSPLATNSCQWRDKTIECSFDIAGYPEPVVRRYGPNSIQHSDDLIIGLFPDPSLVPSGWNRFRAFIEGGAASVRVTGSSAWTPRLRNVIEATQGLPNWFSVVDGTRDTAGATFALGKAPVRQGVKTALAIDFGTTNTLIYSSSDQQVRPGSDAIPFADAHRGARWFGKPDIGERSVLGSFLPGPSYGSESLDPFNVPSAVWSSESVRFIRWSSTSPSPAFSAIGGFKWDRRDLNEDRSDLRADYLIELLWIALPLLAKRMDQPISKVDLGVSFPLAFDFDQKQRFDRLLTTLRDRSRSILGLEIVNVYSISESLACVKAFGTPGDRDKFLIADMGGGTLDVALIKMDFEGSGAQVPQVRQIGSLRLGGEEFIHVLSRKRNPADAEREAWSILDALNHGAAADAYGADPVVAKMLQRFVVSAFEFLRTMVRAYREESGDKDVVRFVLVGNGWHLVSALSPERRRKGDFKVWREFYGDMVRSLSDEGVELFIDEELKVSTKHLAAIGALKNVFVSQQREHQGESEITRLPAGRSMRFGDLELPWSTLVGDVIATDRPSEIRAGALTVGRDPLPASTNWASRLTQAFSVQSLATLPMQSQEKLRERIGRSLGMNPPKIGIGPLQVIIEDDWLTTLENVK